MFSGLLQGLLKGVIGTNDLDKQEIISAAYERVKDVYGEPIADILLEALGRIETEIENGRIRNGIDSNDGSIGIMERPVRRCCSCVVVGEAIGTEDNGLDAINGSDTLHGYDSGQGNASDNPVDQRDKREYGFDERTDSSLPYEGRPYSNINLGSDGCNEITTELERRPIVVPREPKRDG